LNLHKVLEEFLSSAKFAFLTPNDDAGLMFWYGKEQLQKFSDPYYYEMLINFFARRRITLLIYKNRPGHNFSFVEMETGDCLNISNVSFVESSKKRLAKLPPDRDIEFDIIGVSADNQYMVEPPDTISNELMIFKGYRVIE
jgi:hypothetical protein